MRKKCFDEEGVFAFIWKHADHNGIWTVMQAAWQRNLV